MLPAACCGAELSSETVEWQKKAFDYIYIGFKKPRNFKIQSDTVEYLQHSCNLAAAQLKIKRIQPLYFVLWESLDTSFLKKGQTLNTGLTSSKSFRKIKEKSNDY